MKTQNSANSQTETTETPVSDDRTAPPRYAIGVNRRFKNKTGATQLSHPGAWENVRMSMSELAQHHGAGYPWMFSQLDPDSPRKREFSNYAELLAADVDGGMDFAEALANPYILKHCGLIIPSASSTPEHNKFRLVFPLEQPILGSENISIALQYLIAILRVADPACKDASRFFYGAEGKTPILLQDDATLPGDFLTQAHEWDYQKSEEFRSRKDNAPEIKRFESIRDENPQEALDIAREALQTIPRRKAGTNTYPELFRMMCGVINDFGLDGERLLIEWDGGRGEWGCSIEKKIESIKKGSTNRQAGQGTLFWLAKQHGFNFPVAPRKQVATIGKGTQSSKTQKSIKQIVEQCRKILLNEDLSEVEKEIAISELADESGIKEYRLEKFLKPLRRELRKTKFDLEIKTLLLYDSAYEQYKAMMDMAVAYSVSVPTIKVCMERMKSSMRTPNVQAVSLSDRILTSINEPKEWLIKGLLGKGKTLLLNSKAKSGKSRLTSQLAYDLACAVSGQKSQFLGFDIEPGEGGVLYIHPDEDASDLDSRFLDMGYRPNSVGIDVVSDWQITQLAVLEAMLEAQKPRLVIIDSLFAVSNSAGIEEKSPEFGVLVQDLVLLMQKYGTACVLVHHSAKAADNWNANDVNAGRGSSSIGGTVWGVLNLVIPQTKDDESQRNVEVRDGTRILYGKLRGVSEEIRIKLKPNWQTSGFEVEEIDDEDSVSRKTYGERILNVLRLNAKVLPRMTAGQIIEALGGEKDLNKNSVYRALTRLHELGDIEKHWDLQNSNKYYSLSSISPTPEPTAGLSPETIDVKVVAEPEPDKPKETLRDDGTEVFLQPEPVAQQEEEIEFVSADKAIFYEDLSELSELFGTQVFTFDVAPESDITTVVVSVDSEYYLQQAQVISRDDQKITVSHTDGKKVCYDVRCLLHFND